MRCPLENKYDHINAAISFSNLVRSTLGPKGMNKMVISDGSMILTNDGAAILGSIKTDGNPIWELFKSLSKSQEQAVGDGTTTTSIIAGQLLTNALSLMNKGIHPTTVITGYSLASMESLRFLNSKKEKVETKDIIRTAFGTKISEELIDHLTEILLQVKNFEKLRVHTIENDEALGSDLFRGFVFEGFTLNERMPQQTEGNIAVLDFPVNLKTDKFHVTDADELKKITTLDTDYKRQIVDKLVEKNVKCVFYTDTTPEFESYLTEKGISGIVVYQRDNVDGICNAINAIAASNADQIDDRHIGFGKMNYVKGARGTIYVSEKDDPLNEIFEGAETLVIKGPTKQTLDETLRALDDVIRLMRHDLMAVVGAGAIEIELSLHISKFAEQIGGKEQLAIEAFSEALESIPMIIAENAGLDAIEVLTLLKALHNQGKNDMGVDIFSKVSSARNRKIFEPVLVKLHAIASATDVANLILKIDGILQGEKK